MIIAEFRVISISMSISIAICFIKKSFHEILLTVTIEMNKTVDDPQGSTEALSESLERQTLPQETLPTGTQVESKEAQHVPTEAQHAPTEEGRLVPTAAQHMPTGAQHMPTGAPHLFQELKTEFLGTQNMPQKIETEASGFMQTEVAFEHIENDSKPNVII